MDWIRGEKLGHGSFATVNLAVPRSGTSNLPPLMAVKSSAFPFSSSLMNEKTVLDELRDCPHIIDCFGETVSYENGEKLYNILLDYAPGGSLADKIRDSGDRGLPEFEVRRYAKALLRGLDYIHRFGYVHCDLKPQNMLLFPNGVVRIADFGLAKKAAAKRESGGCLRGTPMYMSPEMVAGGEQGAAADVWALGCAVAEMLAGDPAWRCSHLAGLLMKIGTGRESPEMPEGLSGDGRDFLGKCFARDPSERWTAQMLLDHPFICGDGEDDDIVLEIEAKQTTSTSPRCPFDFSGDEWVSCSITSLPPMEWDTAVAAERLRDLISGQSPDWFVWDDWVTVR